MRYISKKVVAPNRITSFLLLHTLCATPINWAVADELSMSQSVSANQATLEYPNYDACNFAPTLTPHSSLIDGAYGRLRPDLRAAARMANPRANLVRAATAYLRGEPRLAQAFADLCVSGRRSYHAWQEQIASGQLTLLTLQQELRNELPNSEVTDRQIEHAATSVWSRTQDVAFALLHPQSGTRPALGYVAVSSEDDPAHRPVNGRSAPVLQSNLQVSVGPHQVETRYALFGRGVTHDPVTNQTIIPENSKVILYIHGLGSRLEEAIGFATQIERQTQSNEPWIVLAVDMPGFAYSNAPYPHEIADVRTSGQPQGLGFHAGGRHETPIMDFEESFLVEFMKTVTAFSRVEGTSALQDLPLRDHIVAVAGGSLGGHLSFRLGRRSDIPWVKNIISWSIGSVWSGFADGANLLTQLAVVNTWRRGGGTPEEFFETPESRGTFIDRLYTNTVSLGPITFVSTTSSQWWNPRFPCHDRVLENSLLDRHEVYSPRYRHWYWRLAMEQLIYSHQSAPNLSGNRFDLNRTRQLILAGSEDNFPFARIFHNTVEMATQMHQTPGALRLMSNTGHSIHTERPRELAELVLNFLR